MSKWMTVKPSCGWEAFEHASELTEFLWSRLVASEWYYLNLTSRSSMWEHRIIQESMVEVECLGEVILDLRVIGKAGIHILEQLQTVFATLEAADA